MLLEKDGIPKKENNLPQKAKEHLQLNHQPYLLKPENKTGSYNKYLSAGIRWYAKMLVFTCKHSFFLARIVSKIRIPVFENAEEAIQVFRQIIPKDQADLCLPRSLFVAVTSKQFKQSGAVFIGVFLPSTAMHAWVVENNRQPDDCDGIWINFQPVAMLCNK